MRRVIIRSGLEALYFTGMHRWLGGACGGAGVILTLHHVRPPADDAFQSGRELEIAPAFLEATVGLLRRHQLEPVSLDEMAERLKRGSSRVRFVCLTFDDGYRDNLEWAYPILKRHRIPFAIYLTTGVPDGQPCLWWRTVDRAVAAAPEIEITIGGAPRRLACRTAAEKVAAVAEVHRLLRALPDEAQRRAVVADLAAQAGVDACAPTRELGLTWDELRMLAADPLVTIGAHTVSHPFLCKLPVHEARREMAAGAARIKDMLGTAPAHFSYPYGDAGAAGPRDFALAREAGFATAVTTRPGVLFPEHRMHLWALPRISLNGEMQRLRYLDVLVSGAGTAVFNCFRRVNVASPAAAG
jgi:peptidoglycan/xylan/chitin deacetylase (PgdA/CDA1 family)